MRLKEIPRQVVIVMMDTLNKTIKFAQNVHTNVIHAYLRVRIVKHVLLID